MALEERGDGPSPGKARVVLRGVLGKMLVIAASMGVLLFGATEWLKHEWDSAPTHYPDGRVVHPDGRVEYPDGRVVEHGKDKSGKR